MDPGALFRNIPVVVKNLLIINLLAFVATQILVGQGIDLKALGGLYYVGFEGFAPYQIVTSMFLHGDLGHFFFNMFALLMFGSMLEKVWGAKKFLIFYLACGIGASVLHNLTTGIFGYMEYGVWSHFPGLFYEDWAVKYSTDLYPSMYDIPYMGVITPAIGASGALYGLLAAVWRLFPNMELMLIFLPVPIKAKYFVPVLLGIDLFLGIGQFGWDSIAHFAHLGGALIGFIMVTYWQKNKRNF